VPTTLGFKPLFKAQSSGHCPEWSDSLKLVKVQGNNDVKVIS